MADYMVHRGLVSIAVRDHEGAGAAMVLLHGGGRTLCDWNPVLPFLGPSHHLVALDFRSHGQSTPCADSWTFADALADLEAVIAHLGLQRPFIVGHSLGGMVATLYGARHPDCPGVVNVDGIGTALPSRFPGPDPAAARQRVSALIAQMAADLPAAVASSAPLDRAEVDRRLAQAREQAEQRGDDWATLGPAVARQYVRGPDGRFHENPSPAAVAALASAVAGFATFSVLRQVRCPVLFVAAGGTDAPGPNAGDELAEVMDLWRIGVAQELDQIRSVQANVRWVQVPCGHMVPLERPAELAAHLLAFTAELMRKSSQSPRSETTWPSKSRRKAR